MLSALSVLVVGSLALFVAGVSPGRGRFGATELVAQVIAAPAPAPTHDPLAYDDAGMHFRAPDGWTRVDIGALTAGSDEQTPPAAVFVYHAGQRDQRSIVISIAPFDGTLEGFESSKETELRNAADGTFVNHGPRTMLGNGMPAYFLKVSQPGGDAGSQLRRYDFVVYDLTRGIDVAYVGRYGDFDENDVRTALGSLSVVVYPRGRR